ncbi:hypothetical protein E1258_01160 [Micromonospora sp. KC207]|uniref:hypothetical protein n=1 Tax=Micromonospora sp. KC207 TaxID=2530377 RepID=UPI00104F86D7|nr:hypothetical protein [Micromonospora sp. KC207]TDC67004.1 hypothetical protein E1258_01160 [Micromonospora sp. KC207]
MSNNHPPYGGQPDPNVTPWGGPPAQPAGYPAYGQPGYGQPGPPPQFAAPVPPPRKSNRGLIIGLAAGAVVVVLAICGAGIGLALVGNDDDPTPKVSGPASVSPSNGNPQPGTDNSAAPEPSESEEQPGSNDAVTARYSSDLSSVCDGSPILNAAAYSGPSGAKAYTFANSIERPTFWSTKSVSSEKPYYAKSADFESVSVVACLKVNEGSEGTPKKCDYKDNSGKRVSISYISSRYAMTFYAAKTGEKIGDGGTVNAPANRCPSFISYNKLTMRSYASPDSGTIEAALDKFLS